MKYWSSGEFGLETSLWDFPPSVVKLRPCQDLRLPFQSLFLTGLTFILLFASSWPKGSTIPVTQHLNYFSHILSPGPHVRNILGDPRMLYLTTLWQKSWKYWLQSENIIFFFYHWIFRPTISTLSSPLKGLYMLRQIIYNFIPSQATSFLGIKLLSPV